MDKNNNTELKELLDSIEIKRRQMPILDESQLDQICVGDLTWRELFAGVDIDGREKMAETFGFQYEEWRDIPGFEGRYRVSNLGRVMSVKYGHTNRPGIHATHVNQSTGYVQVQLYGKHTRQVCHRYVHRLVAQAFIPNPEGLEQVDHIDNNKQNCARRNLRWVSRSFNNSRPHAKLMRKLNRDRNFHTGEFVKVTNLSSGEVTYFKNASGAAHFIGVSHVMAIKVLRGQFKQTSGYALQYVDRNSPECASVREHLLHTKGKYYRTERSRRAMERNEALKDMDVDERNIVYQCDPLTGEVIREWKHPFQVIQELKFYPIYEVLLGLRETTGGYIWRDKHMPYN